MLFKLQLTFTKWREWRVWWDDHSTVGIVRAKALWLGKIWHFERRAGWLQCRAGSLTFFRLPWMLASMVCKTGATVSDVPSGRGSDGTQVFGEYGRHSTLASSDLAVPFFRYAGWKAELHPSHTPTQLGSWLPVRLCQLDAGLQDLGKGWVAGAFFLPL